MCLQTSFKRTPLCFVRGIQSLFYERTFYGSPRAIHETAPSCYSPHAYLKFFLDKNKEKGPAKSGAQESLRFKN
jgi:hypothetical protein